MKTSEAHKLLEESIEYYDERTTWDAKRRAFEMWSDLSECIMEGYVEGIEEDELSYKNGILTVKCSDGFANYDGAKVRSISTEPKRSERRTSSYGYRMSPYERTRAMVYATGNKWQIENFNATH